MKVTIDTKNLRGPSVGQLRRFDSKAFVALVRDALTAAKGSVPAAAEALEVPVRNLWRWIAEHPEVRDGLDMNRPGRPSGKTKP